VNPAAAVGNRGLLPVGLVPVEIAVANSNMR